MSTGIGQYGFGAKSHRYADAGKYFTATNSVPGTGVVTGVVTALAATTPYIILKNNNTVASGIKCYLDALQLYCTVVGTTFAASRQCAHHIDSSQSTTRYTSTATSIHGSGQTLPINNVNADSGNASGALVYVGPIVAAAAGAARLVSSHAIRSAIEVAFDTYTFDFGGAQQQSRAGLIDNSTTVTHAVFSEPPIIVGPQEHYLFTIWGGTMTVGITFGYNLAWIEA